MSKELETQIEDSLFKEKVLSFYKKNKILIIIFLALIILTPISLQTYFYLEDKKNEHLISEYLKAEILLNNDKDSAIKILLTFLGKKFIPNWTELIVISIKVDKQSAGFNLVII